MRPQVPVVWWSNRPEITPHLQWDSGQIHQLIRDELWTTGFDFVEHHGDSDIVAEFGVVVVAARHHVGDVDAINRFINRFNGVVLILLGDEEAVFPWRDVQHDRIRFWVMMPHPIRHADMVPWAYFFGTGCKQDTNMLLDRSVPSKSLGWVFAGQSTHARRKQAVDGLSKASKRTPGELHPTSSFTSGLERPRYMELLRDAKIAPCPSGPCTADTMRLYEALEAGCLPIVDTGPDGGQLGFWEFCYGPDHPLIEVNDWGSVGGVIEAELGSRWPRNANLTSAWWRQQKRGMAKRMVDDLQQVGAPPPGQNWWDKVTVVVTTSPIPSHPSMDVLLETLASITASFEAAGATVSPRLVVACDGVRTEQKDLAPAYDEYVRQVCWQANQWWDDVVPVVSKYHRHQARMMKYALEHVDTPVVLVAEHDTPFSGEAIQWQACVEMMAYGTLDVLRFSHEASIHPEHRHLCLDATPQTVLDVPIVRTRQWSQRPHLARTDYYRRILDDNFSPSGNSFIEDRMHGVVQSQPVDRNRIAIYHPEGTIRRTLHTDGRAGGPKFADKQSF